MALIRDDVIKEGLVVKQSRHLKVWRRRWLVLTAEHLFAFRSRFDTLGGRPDPTEAILLRECSVVKSADEDTGKNNSFLVGTPGRVFYIITDSAAEKESWIRHISQESCSPTVETGWPPRFSVTVAKLGGQAVQIDGLEPHEVLLSLRKKTCVEMGMPAACTRLCFGTRLLGADDLHRTLRELGLRHGAALTCVRAPGAVLGGRCYALTERRLRDNEDLLAAAHAEFGEQATVADFESLDRTFENMGGHQVRDFINKLGLYGGAFVLHKGVHNDGNGGHFFVCWPSGAIPKSWLAHADVNSTLEDDTRMETIRLDLCLASSRVLPVIADLGLS